MVLQKLDVVDPLHERIADQVGMLGDEVEVAKVLRGQRRQIELGSRKTDGLAGLQPDPLLARGVNLDLGPAGAPGDDPRRRSAAVDEQVGADGAIYEEAEAAAALARLVLFDRGADAEEVRRETTRIRQSFAKPSGTM